MNSSFDSSDSPAGTTRATLGEEVCEHLRDGGHDAGSVLCRFAREFFAKAPPQLAQERSVEELSALTEGAFRFLADARPDRVDVQVINPEAEGWSAPVTIVRASLGDRPFIVDTIREFLSAEGLVIHHYIYPILRVVRDESGEPVRLGERGEGRAESLVHVEITRIDEPERREEIRSEIERRLTDVVAATDDFRPMLEELRRAIHEVEEYARRFPDRAPEFEEVAEFLRWLQEDNFVFLGYRAYDIREGDGGRVLQVEAGSGLGILRVEERSSWASGVRVDRIPEPLRRRVVAGPPLIVTKTNAESTVHRRARMDYIGVKKLDDAGRVTGERRFLGLFTSKAYAEHAEVIPILRRKLESLLSSSGTLPGSHDYKEIITIFNSMPKEELFQTSTAELEREVQMVLGLLFSDEVQLTMRPDPLERGVSVMVILPRGRFSGEVRQRIQEVLTSRLEGTVLNYHLAMSAGDQARLHFYLSAPAERVREVRSADVADDIRQIVRSWEDRLLDALVKSQGQAEAHRLYPIYSPILHDEYRAATSPEVAVQDVEEIELMRREDRQVAVALHEPRDRADARRGVTILKLYLWGERLVLSDFMPILDNAGLRVLEVTPFSLSGPGLEELMVYSFLVQDRDGQPVPVERADILSEALLAVRRGDTTNDAFNALVLAAGLRWREVDVLRTYANYAFQTGAVPARYGVARALARYPELARLLVRLFRARFDPEAQPAGGGAEDSGRDGTGAIRDSISSALEGVATLADDRALRRMASLIEATTRTNYFRHGGADPTFRSGGVPYISIKVRCADAEELRRSRLLYEIFVFSSRMEGIHLRAAPVSRGGIRWSDRPDDFRTEVLGLVQTQIVKNSVIVPSGSKGGFITKRTLPDREQMMQEAADQYRTLIRGMLDITDNLVEGRVVHPEGVVRHDPDDPYLVVAADKGTAHLSDVANAISEEYGFWLGDAFASGGSHGYDHKKQGITARGAWESVKRHFREIGKNVQEEPFTVAGIGDMSGDVFGNGMLLSRQIRLVAAFDHRHVFIDPDPDPAVSYAERERLFRTPRSSWDDYDRGKLSAGAMIVPRASKEVTVTPEAAAVLGLDEGVERLDGEALVRAVLRAPVELLWNGGIGTYVKDSEETNAEVGDSTNDPVRVNADELRAQVVGEGGNLGFTQRARITYALRGGRINTDALDNSAGVDMSDHEVNLKILLNPMVAAGQMPFDARNELLEEMTEEVSRLVLRNNIGQSLAVSLDEARSREALGDFAALITAFERDRMFDRGAVGIPGSGELEDRARDGLGLTRPTLAVLLSYAKLQAGARVLDSPVPDDPATQSYLVDYFPPAAVEAAGEERLREHRLRREIVTTYLVSDLVDLMGASFLHRVARDTGQEIAAVVRAWYIASEISGAGEIRTDLEGMEGTYPAQTIYRWLFALGRVLERTTRWILANLDPRAETTSLIEEHRSGLSRLRGEFSRLVTGEDREIFLERLQELRELGVEETLAARLLTLRFLPELLDILRVAGESSADVVDTARAYYHVSERLQFSWLQQMLRSGAHGDAWEKRLAQALLADSARAHRRVSQEVLDCRRQRGGEVEECLAEVESRRARELQRYLAILEELRAADHVPLAGYAVAVRALLELAGI